MATKKTTGTARRAKRTRKKKRVDTPEDTAHAPVAAAAELAARASEFVGRDADTGDDSPSKSVAAEPKEKVAARRKRRRPKAKRKTSGAEAGPASKTAEDVSSGPESEAESPKAAGPAAGPGARKKSAKRRGRKRRRPAADRLQPDEAVVAEAAQESVAGGGRAVTPLSPNAQVEAQSGAVVIRFPPALPDPALAEPSGPASVEGRVEPSLSLASSEAVAEPAAEAGAVAAVEPPQPSAREDGVPAGLSPSQKRRLRRKRRAEALREVGKAGNGKASRPAPAEEIESGVPAQPESEVSAEESASAKSEKGPREEQPKRRRRSRRRGSRAKEPAAAADVQASDEKAPAVEEEPKAAPAAPVAASPVTKEMVINVVPREECRIAILEGGKLEEIYLERASSENHVGNIYKGVVTNVEASIQAAFVDFGLGKNGFLHISDLHPQYFPDREGQTEHVGRKTPRRKRPPIQRCLRRGQEIVVQITKEGIGTKGPTLSTYLAIPGRFMVMMPGMSRLGVSRKIEDDELRHKLREQLGELELPKDMGFIARTAAEGHTKRELQSDHSYLMRLWRAVEKRTKSERAPAELYRESDLVIRTIRDVFTSDIERIMVDDPEVAERAREFLSIFSPRSRDAVVEYEDPGPIFHKYGIEAELERLHSRHVPLKSGGSLVIDPTEALVAIDVNSGRFRTEDDAEITAYKINLEAADEIPRQLRLRDMGGVIICDFIDMRQESHRRDIERRLARNLRQHKERAKVLRMSGFGIIEMTRQRQRASLTRSVYQDCHHCRGTGLVKTVESVALDVTRLLQLAVSREHIHVVEVSVSRQVADVLQNRKRALIHEFETRHRRTISIRPGVNFGLDQVQIQCYDHRGRLVPHP